jgi:peptidoglycan/LPS O-acetylase OafA/YrhL
LIIAAALLQTTVVQEYALYIALFYLVMVAASPQRLRAVRLSGDLSYGVYLYGWPIQQTVAQFLPDLTSYPSNLICIPAALLAAYVSWDLIERPALLAGRRFSARKPPDTVDASVAV